MIISSMMGKQLKKLIVSLIPLGLRRKSTAFWTRTTVYVFQVLFLFLHLIMHLVTYILPKLFFNSFILWPVTVLEWKLGKGYSFGVSKRCITVISSSTSRSILPPSILDEDTEECFHIQTVQSTSSLPPSIQQQLESIGSQCSQSFPAFVENPREFFSLPPRDGPTSVPWMYSAPLYLNHISTIFGHFRPRIPIEYQRHTLRADDDNLLYIDYKAADGLSRTFGIILIIPGLTSSPHVPYIESFVEYATSNGFHVYVLNTRGMPHGPPLSTPVILSGKFTSDLRCAIEKFFTPGEVLARHPSPTNRALPVFAVGFSMGGNILCNYLAEESQEKKPQHLSAAIALCSPWDFHATSDRMSRFEQMLLYQPQLTSGLTEYLERFLAEHSSVPNVDLELVLRSPKGLKSLRTIQDIDKHIIAPHWGYDSVEEYYSDAGCFSRLNVATGVPTLCIAALDDPLTGPSPNHRRWEGVVQQNPSVVFVELPVGGHLGFLDTPGSEFAGLPNFAERLMLKALKSACVKVTGK